MSAALALVPDDAEQLTLEAFSDEDLREDERAFDNFLDEEFGSILIGDSEFYASEVLKTCGEQDYRDRLINWREERKSEREKALVRLISERFPTPIAFHFDKLQKGCRSDQQRVRVIRDVWESLIFVLYGLLLGEVRARGFSLAATDIKRGQLLSDKINERLSIMAKIVALPDAARDLVCSTLITPQLVEELTELNRARNEFSHEESESERQAAEILAKNRPALMGALHRVLDLAEITLMRYEGQKRSSHSRDVHEVQGVVFCGSSTNQYLGERLLSQTQVAESLADLTDSHIVAHVGGARGRIWSVAPFLHFKEHDEGHSLRICYYKTKHAVNPSEQNSPREFDYSVSGTATKYSIAESAFAAELDELWALLPNLSERNTT